MVVECAAPKRHKMMHQRNAEAGDSEMYSPVLLPCVQSLLNVPVAVEQQEDVSGRRLARSGSVQNHPPC